MGCEVRRDRPVGPTAAFLWAKAGRTKRSAPIDALSPGCRAGISLKTQELYALVFICRYLDLFYSFISV